MLVGYHSCGLTDGPAPSQLGCPHGVYRMRHPRVTRLKGPTEFAVDREESRRVRIKSCLAEDERARGRDLGVESLAWEH